ncbi:hypothetical protein UPYG_G00284950 [Umbra pygmaea]|uniref:Uncharacterized protein n=1 Tax=Umbra pygmaea TaxID=75934 RepID=A0ABD0WJL7_UMBPY
MELLRSALLIFFINTVFTKPFGRPGQHVYNASHSLQGFNTHTQKSPKNSYSSESSESNTSSESTIDACSGDSSSGDSFSRDSSSRDSFSRDSSSGDSSSGDYCFSHRE